MRRPFLSVFILVFLLFTVSCGMDPNLNGGNDVVYEDSADWMGRLSGDTLIKDIVIPATHDSCAVHDFLGISSLTSTQDLNLEEQLEAGVRSLDIRIHSRGDGYGIYHGLMYMNIMMDDVIDACREFLSEHPTEFILLFFQYEQGQEFWHSTPVVEKLRASDTELFYQGTTFENVKVSDLAGKIVPILNYFRSEGDPDLLEERDFWHPEIEYGFWGGNYWETENPSEIYDEAKFFLEKCRTGDRLLLENPSKVTTSSYFHGQFGLPNYRIVSSYVNPRFLEWFKQYEGTGATLGIVQMDHITRELCHAIYSINDLN